MINQIHDLLEAWFGEPGVADLPTSNRTGLWFGESTEARVSLLKTFEAAYQAACRGELAFWEETIRGRLALIILLDQFSRMLYPESPNAFSHDAKTVHLCLESIEHEQDQALTLIERVFFYMPLVHAEDIALQEKSIRLYEELVVLSMPEAKQIYQLFLAYAYAHFKVIKTFGRFPQRNASLGRVSTEAELAFLKRAASGSGS